MEATVKFYHMKRRKHKKKPVLFNHLTQTWPKVKGAIVSSTLVAPGPKAYMETEEQV